MPKPTTSTHGILRPHAVGKRFELHRYPVTAELAQHIERYWSVHWDLAEREPYQVETIPHPCVNLTIMPGLGAQMHGVGTKKSVHPLAGEGWVFGVKFRPGGFGAYSGLRVASLTDRSLPLSDLYGSAADELATEVIGARSDLQRIALVDRFLRERCPTEDEDYARVLGAIGLMLDDRSITRVTHVAERCRVSVRSLQRLFERYVGVSPKWVIRRYRLHDGAQRLANGGAVDPAQLAVELGWFDQAHFTRDFTALVGLSPLEYAAICQQLEDTDGPFVRT